MHHKLKNTLGKWDDSLKEHKAYLARTLNKNDKQRDELTKEMIR